MSTGIEIDRTNLRVSRASMDGALEEVCFDNQDRSIIKTRRPDPLDGVQERVVFRASIIDGSVEPVQMQTILPYPFDVQESIRRLGGINNGKK